MWIVLVLSLVFQSTDARSFTIDYENDCYLKDGECYRYIAGEMHYFRIPAQYWTDRLLKLRAAGFTAVQTYIPWNVHVPEEHLYKFDGIADCYRYFRIAGALGLDVIVRPGPFLATEWDYGGFPGWLLKDRPTLDVRRNETVYMGEVRRWYAKLLPTLVPYLYQNGGPIIAVQVENEYGSNKPCDAAHYDYLHQLRAIYREHLGEEVVLLTVDGDSHRLAECGNIEGLYSTVNFGAGGKVEKKFGVQRLQEPHGPYVCSAFFSGWLDHWGHRFARTGAGQLGSSLTDILEFANRSASVSMYMFHGGTNFAYMQGGRGDWDNATTPAYPRLWGKMTSYDYDAPLSEAGDTTWKYQVIRDVISNFSKVYEVPANTTKQHLGEVHMEEVWDVLEYVDTVVPGLCPQCVLKSEYPLPMEQMGQNHGLVMYTTTIPDDIDLPADIDLGLYGDRVYVMEEEGEVQISSRNRPPKTFSVNSRDLYILVEDNGHSNTGHVRYSYQYYQKGIVGNVTANRQVLKDWTATLITQTLPREPYETDLMTSQTMRELLVEARRSRIRTKRRKSRGYIPTFYMSAGLPGLVDDTYIDTQGWGKGLLMMLYKEGSYNLGRYWPLAGPQLRHYTPSRDVTSTPVVFMLELEQAPGNSSVLLTDTPLVDGPYDPTQE